MEILLVLVVGILMLTAFYMGKESKENIGPIKTIGKVTNKIEEIKNNQEQKQEEKLKAELHKKELENIDNFDGTDKGQHDLS